MSINALMVALVDHASHELWNVEKEGAAPKNDQAWQEVEHHATQLAGAGTLIAVGGTGQADPGWAQSPEWKKYPGQLNEAGLAAMNAARAKNLGALVKANGQLVESVKAVISSSSQTSQPRGSSTRMSSSPSSCFLATRFAGEAVGAGVPIEARVVTGSPADEIAALAAEERIGVVVMHLRKGPGLFGSHAGSIAYHVLRHAVSRCWYCPTVQASRGRSAEISEGVDG